MHLKKICISGFKSFADKIVITLDNGITGVVGPNGSGKSNVIDAVRWVMGEQNAKNLRGEKATDIIFAGSERRKPLGMAEVSLIFDNAKQSSFCPPEYRHEPEITLTRRIYADGQREYMINRKPCRLKDIISFFSVTGLGGKSYSMIQQGQVDRILNAKPEDMREILEEAAGTMIYKKRRNEAERKLEKTRINLSRIDDILIEIEKNLETLQGQKEKAQKYRELSDKLREEELTLFAHNFKNNKEKQIDLNEKHEAGQTQEIDYMRLISELEVVQTQLQSQMDEADPEMQQLQEAVAVLREEIARAESTLKTAEDKLQTGARRLEEIDTEMEEDDSNLKVLESQVDSASEELGRAEIVAAELRDEIDSFSDEAEQAEESASVYHTRMEELKDELRNVERLLEANTFKTESASEEMVKIKREFELEAAKEATLKESLASVREQFVVAEERAGKEQAGLDKEIREKHEKEAAISDGYARLKELNASRDDIKEEYHTVRARFTSLQELESGATDVAGNFAKLKENYSDMGEICHGLLADYIKYKDAAQELPEKARSAIERWAERLIIRDLGSFNQLVRYAHDMEVGGTLPVSITSLGEGINLEAARQWADDFGAESILTYLEPDNAPSEVNTLLERLYFSTALSLDQSELSQMPAGLVLFNAQGVSYQGNDDLVVGSKSAAGLLSRKAELEGLASRMKEIEARLASVQTEIDNVDYQVNVNRQDVAAIDERLQSQNKDVIEVMSLLESAKKDLNHKSEQLENTLGAIEDLKQREQQCTETIDTLQVSREALDQERVTSEADLLSLQEESEAVIERRDEYRRMLESKRLDLAKSETRSQALKDGYLNQKAQLELLQNRLSRKYEEKARINDEMQQAKVNVEQARVNIERFVKEREVKDQEFSMKREENSGLITQLREVDNSLREKRDGLAKVQRQMNDVNISLERVNSSLEAIQGQAAEKYHLDIADFEFEYQENFNSDSKARTVGRLRSKIEELGDINMMALAEYEEKAERKDFMTRQREEVIASMDLLETAILEIEETSERKFVELYEMVRTEFGNLFPILFPGGEGELELTNPDAPLEGGIEILCRLPGKSRKAMSLFSGGEKALTAISLIFALLKSKPTPFCFLDEVDAPLDETNVGRYNRVLEALSDQFQFVVITHNRRTMEVLDTLYGVTMQEPGVSKVVGVDMQRDLPAHLRKAMEADEKKAAAH